MARRLNIILSDSTWDALKAIPRGERSRFIDMAVAKELQVHGRREAAAAMDALRETMDPVAGCSEAWIRGDRETH